MVEITYLTLSPALLLRVYSPAVAGAATSRLRLLGIWLPVCVIVVCDFFKLVVLQVSRLPS